MGCKMSTTLLDGYESEVYTVTVTRNIDSGVAVLEEWRNEKGQYHRPLRDGPALLVRAPTTGAVRELVYWLNNTKVDPETGNTICPVGTPLRKYKRRNGEPEPR